MSGPARQQIRPTLAELRDLPPEYDFMTDEEDAEEDEDDEPTYAPAATPSRTAPPTIGIQRQQEQSTSVNTTKKSVRIQEDDIQQANRASSRPRQQHRFDIRLDEQSDVKSDDEQAQTKATLAPLIGTIQERKPSGSGVQANRSERAGQSRFAARMQLDRDAGLTMPQQRSKPTEAKTQPHFEDEEWLDDQGQPMSAFRKSRLIKQGLRPPNARPLASTSATVAHTVPANVNDIQDDSIVAMMRSIGAENEAKVASMTAEEVESEMRDLEDVFGSALLQMFKNRNTAAAKSNEVDDNKGIASDLPSKSRAASSNSALTSTEIRQKFFPDEPESMPSTLEWTGDLHVQEVDGNDSPTPRFDFDGKLLGSHQQDDTTHYAGLHNHGQEQHRPGYTVEELLHLARSVNPSQRVMALQTLTRIAARFPEKPGKKVKEDSPSDAHTSLFLARLNLRGQACIIASWYAENRQINVRSAALACIQACLSTAGQGTLGTSTPFVERRPYKESAALVADTQVGTEEKERDVSTGRKLPFVHDEELRVALVPCLVRSLQLKETTTFEMINAFESLLLLTQSSRKLCAELSRETDALVQVLHQHILEQGWPSKKPTTQVSLRFMRLVDTLIAGSRSAALRLLEGGAISPLQRYLSIAPWSITDTELQNILWQHMDSVLQIYTSLGRYGLASDTYGRSYSLFRPVQEWVLRFNVNEAHPTNRQEVLHALRSCLRLFSVWTVCATDAHQTHQHHDITWSQVSEWWECALAAIDGLNKGTDAMQDNEGILLLCVQAEAIRLLAVWMQGASVNRKSDLDAVSPHLERLAFVAISLLKHIDHALDMHVDALSSALRDDDTQRAKNEFGVLAQLYRSASAVADFATLELMDSDGASMQNQLVDLARKSFEIVPWSASSSVELEQLGIVGEKRDITDFLYAALRLKQAEGLIDVCDWLRLAVVVPGGGEELVDDILLHHVAAKLGPSADGWIRVIKPFLVELTRTNRGARMAPLDPKPGNLATADTLFQACEEVGDKEAELDPLSGVPLWKCSNAGLPLRHDWPLGVLDDLLHSGNCAALNRPNALPPHWDANEVEIVTASLELAAALWEKHMNESGVALDVWAAPSADEVYLGIMKVFMLEEDQAIGSSARATGKITGRDIYRNARVSTLLSTLFDIANDLQRSSSEGVNDRADSLERAAERQFGKALPFYQLYTSFVGLYDAISYGDELFGRALLVGLQMQYAVDYRRLIWTDYAHCLPTITTKVEDAPGTLQAYVARFENDDTVIRGMALALMGGYVRKGRNGLLFSIAVQQLGALLWTRAEDEEREASRRNQLMKMLFIGQASDSAVQGSLTAEYVVDMRASLLQWSKDEESGSADEQDNLVEERKQLVRQACQC